jgi:phosphohistidine swiveling domain-containing protein
VEHRERFDVLLGQARDAMDLRDDNGPVTAEWPMGILRLSLLELGRRMQQHGLIDDAALVMELHPLEITAELFTSPPSTQELHRRADLRRVQRSLDAPRRLGHPEPPPPLAVLPESLATLVAMVQTTMAQLGMDGVDDESGPGADGVLRGAGIGTDAVRAVARVAVSADEALDRLGPGEILVVEGTTPAYNLVLSMAGGVVTAEGGAMSHAAVIARELGISAIIGVRGAMSAIADGDVVELDPQSGTVTVVQHAAQV